LREQVVAEGIIHLFI